MLDEDLTLGLLSERKLNWQTLVTSYGFEALLVIVVINIGLIWPDNLQLRRSYHVTELIPIPSNQPTPVNFMPKAPPLRVKALPATPVTTPMLTLPEVAHATLPRGENAEAPKIAVNQFAPATLVQTAGAARMARIVRTGEFGSSIAPTIAAPAQKVQTGGFGDPNGLRGEGKENPKAMIAKVGSFDLPQGARTENGGGGGKALTATVASAGFGSGIAVPANGDGRGNGGGAVTTGGFGAQAVAQLGAKPLHPMEAASATTPVEIVSKPNPIYTTEARQLHLEGEVLLEVMFGANGRLHVNHVVRGLGHGLDEAAVTAANQIRFNPAARNGSALDSTAVIHVLFQLAY